METRSEQGIMASREPFLVGLQKQPVQPQQPMPAGMRLAFAPDGMAIYKPVASSSPPNFQGGSSAGGAVGATTVATAGGGDASNGAVPSAPTHGLTINMGDPVKRKRGRPRKYGPDGSLNLSATPISASGTMLPGAPGFSPSSAGSTMPLSASVSPDGVKKRGRPPGSGRKHQMAALGTAGVGFTPHIITVKAGEDVSAKIMSFSQHGPRAVCILSANGSISNVTLRQAATSGGTVTYEGRFEILSLSGSYLVSESGGQPSRTGGLSISLAGPNGRVFGGGVAGLLTAASPVQVVVGSFVADGKKAPKQAMPTDFTGAPGKLAPSGGTAGGNNSPPSRGTFSESSGGPGSPLHHSTGPGNNNMLGLSSMAWK